MSIVRRDNMRQLLSFLPPFSWVLLFFVLVCSVSYLYVNNKHIGKMAMAIFVALVLIGGWSYGMKAAQTSSNIQVK